MNTNEQNHNIILHKNTKDEHPVLQTQEINKHKKTQEMKKTTTTHTVKTERRETERVRPSETLEDLEE